MLYLGEVIDGLRARVVALEAENKKLRKDIQSIIDQGEQDEEYPPLIDQTVLFELRGILEGVK